MEPTAPDGEVRIQMTENSACLWEELLSLGSPLPADSTSYFGHSSNRRAPVLFSRTLEGQPVSAKDSKLFSMLPEELLLSIVDLLPADSLRTLAFVNSDCLQLARSRLHERINLSCASLELPLKLAREALERADNDGQTLKPALGPCI